MSRQRATHQEGLISTGGFQLVIQRPGGVHEDVAAQLKIQRLGGKGAVEVKVLLLELVEGKVNGHGNLLRVMIKRRLFFQLAAQGALDPRRFANSLRATWVRRLLDPAPQQWKNIV